MKTVFTRFVKDESGATAIEYGLIAAIVAVGIIIGLQNLRDGLNTMFNNLKTQLTTSQRQSTSPIEPFGCRQWLDCHLALRASGGVWIPRPPDSRASPLS